jgi:acyl-CoA dehydrogenase
VLTIVRDMLRQDSKETERYAGIVGHFLGELEALRTLTYLGAWKADQKMDVRIEAANVKLSATELLHRVIDFALEVVGPSGLHKNHVLARIFRHARATRIVEGPSEIQRHIIQRMLFRDGVAGLELL